MIYSATDIKQYFSVLDVLRVRNSVFQKTKRKLSAIPTELIFCVKSKNQSLKKDLFIMRETL